MSPQDRPKSWTVADTPSGAPLNGRLVAAWAFACVCAWLVSGLVAYGIGLTLASTLPIGGGADPNFETHRWTLTTFVAAWGVLAAAPMIGLTAVTIGLPRGAIRRALPWAIVGSAIAAGLEFVLLGWGFARFGVQGADPDLLGPVVFLAMALVAVATSMVVLNVASLVAPRAYFPIVLATLILVAVPSGMIALSVGTFADRTDPDGLVVLGFLVAMGAYLWAAMMFTVKAFGQSVESASAH